jgi:hypothetical protein
MDVAVDRRRDDRRVGAFVAEYELEDPAEVDRVEAEDRVGFAQRVGLFFARTRCRTADVQRATLRSVTTRAFSASASAMRSFQAPTSRVVRPVRITGFCAFLRIPRTRSTSAGAGIGTVGGAKRAFSGSGMGFGSSCSCSSTSRTMYVGPIGAVQASWVARMTESIAALTEPGVSSHFVYGRIIDA